MGALKKVFSLSMWIIGIALIVGALLKLFFVEVIVLGHDAMAPTLTLGEQAFLWRGAEPELGDVVVCEHPDRAGDLIVGRVLGEPGQVVRTERGQLVASGAPVTKEVVGTMRYSVSTEGREAEVRRVVERGAQKAYETFYPDDLELELRETEVEPGRLYLLGDNRPYRGYDSRTFGTVDASSCRGEIFMLFRPTDASAAAFGHGYFQRLD